MFSLERDTMFCNQCDDAVEEKMEGGFNTISSGGSANSTAASGQRRELLVSEDKHERGWEMGKGKGGVTSQLTADIA